MNAATPTLTRLRYGSVYCELCRTAIDIGGHVSWWHVRGRSGRMRRTAYCGDCHHANVRNGRALR